MTLRSRTIVGATWLVVQAATATAATEAPPELVTVAVLVAYDENANRSVDPAEGVRGIPVRLVDVATNRALAQAFTDESGYATIQLQTNAQVSLVIPYFGQSWDISRRWGGGDSTFTLLLPAGNQLLQAATRTQPGLMGPRRLGAHRRDLPVQLDGRTDIARQSQR